MKFMLFILLAGEPFATPIKTDSWESCLAAGDEIIESVQFEGERQVMCEVIDE